MNDNLSKHMLQGRPHDRCKQTQLAELEELREIGIRAVCRPESLTMGEIQEIAWGFLMTAKSLREMALTH